MEIRSPQNNVFWLLLRGRPQKRHGKRRTHDNQSQELEDGEAIMTEQPEKVFFDPFTPERFFLVGSKLSPIDREKLMQTLIDNQDVFA